MSILRIAFFFDYTGYLATLTPVLRSLARGNSDELRELAKVIGDSHPHVWEILSYFYISHQNDDFVVEKHEGPDPRIGFWLLLIMSDYCSEVGHPMPSSALRELRIDEETQSLMQHGRPLKGLFAQYGVAQAALDDQKLGIINRLPAGWLSVPEISRIKGLLEPYRTQTLLPVYERILEVLDIAVKSDRGLLLGAIA